MVDPSIVMWRFTRGYKPSTQPAPGLPGHQAGAYCGSWLSASRHDVFRRFTWRVPDVFSWKMLGKCWENGKNAGKIAKMLGKWQECWENAGKMLGKLQTMLGKCWENGKKCWEHDEKTAKMMMEGWWDSTKMKGGLEKGTLKKNDVLESFLRCFFWSLDMSGGSENFPTKTDGKSQDDGSSGRWLKKTGLCWLPRTFPLWPCLLSIAHHSWVEPGILSNCFWNWPSGTKKTRTSSHSPSILHSSSGIYFRHEM